MELISPILKLFWILPLFIENGENLILQTYGCFKRYKNLKTGNPNMTFIMYLYSKDCIESERLCHKKLAHLRKPFISENDSLSEWFECSIKEAIMTIVEYCPCDD